MQSDLFAVVVFDLGYVPVSLDERLWTDKLFALAQSASIQTASMA